MANSYFKFKQFCINQTYAAMKVGTDGVLLGAYIKCSSFSTILDIGTGTGLIAIMLAQKSDSIIDALEIDKNACIDASENIKNCKWSNRIKLFNTSIQNFIKSELKKYDCIVCNPPYFANSYKSNSKSRNYARHNDDLDINVLFNCVDNLISEKGVFFIIYPWCDLKLVEENALTYNLFLNERLDIKPTPNKEPKRFIGCFSRSNNIQKISSIVIEENGRHNYSKEYIDITKDYYLNF